MRIHDAIYQLYPNIVTIRGDMAVDKDDNEVSYNLQAVTELAKKDDCKQKAKELLAKTDWAVLPDVGLSNQQDFVFYRLNLRSLVINPVVDPVWETEPTPIWS